MTGTHVCPANSSDVPPAQVTAGGFLSCTENSKFPVGDRSVWILLAFWWHVQKIIALTDTETFSAKSVASGLTFQGLIRSAGPAPDSARGHPVPLAQCAEGTVLSPLCYWHCRRSRDMSEG